MKALGRALGVDLRRSVLSGAFLLTVVLMLAWMCFNSAHYLFNPIRWGQISAAKMLFNATCTSFGFGTPAFCHCYCTLRLELPSRSGERL